MNIIKIKKLKSALTLTLLLTTALCGCTYEKSKAPYIDTVSLEKAFAAAETAIFDDAPDAALHDLILPVASGTLTKENAKVKVDYSNTADGYIMICFTAKTEKRLKVRISGPDSENEPYQYNLEQGKWETFPLSGGNGKYNVKVYEQIGDGQKYSVVLSADIDVRLKDEFAPFIRPNQYVDYTDARKTLAAASALTKDVNKTLEKVAVVYNYVVKSLTYDTNKAENVQSGYLPVLDQVLTEKKGICFDYAALMTGMLRSQGIPCKLVIGYVGTEEPAYHAWISVWTEGEGWIDAAVYFDGTAWHRMDPTFASSAQTDKSL